MRTKKRRLKAKRNRAQERSRALRRRQRRLEDEKKYLVWALRRRGLTITRYGEIINRDLLNR